MKQVFDMSALDASKEEKEKFILQQIETSMSATQTEREEYFASISRENANAIRLKEESKMEKKCENCVFCSQKPDTLSFLPNDWICGNYKSKWFNYWPPNGVCEMHTEPTGKTVAEVVGDRGMQAYEGLKMLFNAVCGNNASVEYIDKFLQEDSAILGSYEDFLGESK